MKSHRRIRIRLTLSLVFLWPLLTRADALSQWFNRSFPNASGYNYSLSGITFANNLFVAVGSSGSFGIILTSPDGAVWTARHPQNIAFDTLSVNGVAYGTNLFVGVGASGGLARSADGLNWFYGQITNSATEFSGVTYGGGLFVAVGNGFPLAQTNIATSADGLKWTERRGLLNPLSRVAYGNAEYVAVGGGGLVRSVAGTTWTSVNAGVFYDLAFGNGLFVISGPTGLSVRGLAGGLTLITNSVVRAVTFAAGTFVAAATDGSSMLTSTNGTNWTARATAPPLGWGPSALGYGVGTFVAVASPNRLAQSAAVAELMRGNAPGEFRLKGLAGRVYRLEGRDAFHTNAPWLALTNLLLTNPPQTWTDPQGSGQPRRFYRAQLLP